MSRVIQAATPVNEIEFYPTENFNRTLTFPAPLTAGSYLVVVAATYQYITGIAGEVLQVTYQGSNFAEVTKVHRAASDDMTLQFFALDGAVSAGAGSINVLVEGVLGEGNRQYCHLYAFEVSSIDMGSPWVKTLEVADNVANMSVTYGSTLPKSASFAFGVGMTWPAVLTAQSDWETIGGRSSTTGGITVAIAVREFTSNDDFTLLFTNESSIYGGAALVVGFGVTTSTSPTDSYIAAYAEPAAQGAQNVVGGVFLDNGSVTVGAKITDFVGLQFDNELVDGKAQLRIPLTQAQAAPLSDDQIVRVMAWKQDRSEGIRGVISAVVNKFVSTTPPTPQPDLVPIDTNGIQINSASYARLWGPGVSIIDVLWNADLNASGVQVSYRFRALHSAAMASVRLYWSDGSGYAGGNGGVIRARIYPDDGSGLPNMAVAHFGEFTRTPGNLGMSGGVYSDGQQRFNPDAFTGARQLQAGQIYHLVGENIAASPTVNWSSWDGQGVILANGRNLPWAHGSEWALLRKSGSWDDWMLNTHGGARVVPVMQLNYVGGLQQGSFTMETGNVDSPATVRIRKTGSSASIREQFVPLQRRVFKGISYRVAKVSGSGNLRINIQSATSGELYSFEYADPGNNYTTSSSVVNTNGVLPWVHWTLPSAITFEAGQDYYIQAISLGDSIWAHAPQRNGRAFGSSSPASFTESYAEHWGGSAFLRTYFWNYATDNTLADNNWPFVLHLVP